MAQVEGLTPHTPPPHVEMPATPAPVKLTEKAAEMVKRAMADEKMVDHGLRVGVIGGGCSGLQYLLDFTPRATGEDFVDEQFGIPIFVDQYSAGHLMGTTVDYVDGLAGSGFKIENPNIQRACGCGSSFCT
jgi:iron-sulfur cluster assembly accessory protein